MALSRGKSAGLTWPSPTAAVKVESLSVSPGSDSTWKVKESQSQACAHRQRKKQPELSFRQFKDGEERMSGIS